MGAGPSTLPNPKSLSESLLPTVSPVSYSDKNEILTIFFIFPVMHIIIIVPYFYFILFAAPMYRFHKESQLWKPNENYAIRFSQHSIVCLSLYFLFLVLSLCLLQMYVSSYWYKVTNSFSLSLLLIRMIFSLQQLRLLLESHYREICTWHHF